MHWFSTGLLIALTAGTAGWTGYLLRRLFVVEPAPVGRVTAPTTTASPVDVEEEPHA